jgi:hypothetical protein
MGIERIPVSKGRVGGGIKDHAGVVDDDETIPTSSDIKISKPRKSYDYTPSERKMAVKRQEAQVRYGTKIVAETTERKEVSWGGRLAAVVVVTLVVVFALLFFTPLGKSFFAFIP